MILAEKIVLRFQKVKKILLGDLEWQSDYLGNEKVEKTVLGCDGGGLGAQPPTSSNGVPEAICERSESNRAVGT